MPKQEYDACVPLQYKTWILKVPIHCEGCQKKVKKTLLNIEGVFMTTIDPQQHKVTVTGNVELDTLIRKLLKAGKPSELWRENVDEEEKEERKVGKSKKIREKKGDYDQHSDYIQSDGDSGKEGSNNKIPIRKEQKLEEDEGANEAKLENNGSGESKRKKKKNKNRKKKKKSKSKSKDRSENVVCDQTYVVPHATAIWEPHMEETHRIEHVYPYPSLAYGLNNNPMNPTATDWDYSPTTLYYSYGAMEGTHHFAPPSDRIARVNGYDDYDGYTHDEEESLCFIM